MENRTVQVRTVEHKRGMPLHVVTPEGSELEYAFGRVAEYLLYSTERHTGSLSRALESLGEAAPIALSRNRLGTAGLSLNHTDYDHLLARYTEWQRWLDPLSTRGPKGLSLVPVSSIEAVCVDLRGDQEVLEALGRPVPELWTMQQESSENAQAGYVDLLLEGRITDELAAVSLGEELNQFDPFEVQADDEERLVNYALSPVPRTLEVQLGQYVTWKTRAYAYDRTAPRVVDATAKADEQACLRFCGFLKHVHQVHTKSLLDLKALEPSILQEYAEWLHQSRCIKHASVANYLNQLLNCFKYIATLPDAATLDSNATDEDSAGESHDMLDGLVEAAMNLRAQAERMSKIDKLYQPRSPLWISWEEAKITRLNAISAMEAELQKRPSNRERTLDAVQSALLISFNTVMPPDRVGVIRRLAVPDTLKRQPTGDYYIDLSQMGAHKTARLYGPSKTAVSGLIRPTLDTWLRLTQSGFEFTEIGDEEEINRTTRRYLFAQRNDPARCLSSSAYTALFKRCMERFSSRHVATPPSTLRKVFVTHLKDHTTDPIILQSCATHMKHSLQTQGDVYDISAHLRSTEAAMKFCEEYATLPVGGRAGTIAAAAPAEEAQVEPDIQHGDPALDPINGAPVATVSVPAPVPPPQDEQEWEIRFPTAGDIVRGQIRHRILWAETPKLLDWWGDLPADYHFDSNALVSREIQATVGRTKQRGLIGAIPDGRNADILFADGSKGQLDLMACELRRLDADPPQIVAWELTRPETFELEMGQLPTIINDSHCDFDHSPPSKDARRLWVDSQGRLFPTFGEALAILTAAKHTVDDREGSCALIEAVLALDRGADRQLVVVAIGALQKLTCYYQQGSCLYDACQTLLSECTDTM